MNHINHLNHFAEKATEWRGRGARREGRTHRHGPGFGPGFGPGAGYGRGAGFGPGFGPGPGPGSGPDFAEAGWPRGPRGPRGGRGPRRGRRGDVRKALLALLAEQPMNGYQLITAIAERSDGVWQPGPGSVYPALGLLHEEGLIAPDESDTTRRKVYTLTDEGRAFAEDHSEELAAVWEQATSPHHDYRDMRREFGQLAGAFGQVAVGGDERQLDAARAVLADARRALYRILAEVPAVDSPETGPGSAEPTDSPGAG